MFSSSDRLNSLYDIYLVDHTQIEPLLEAARPLAMSKLRQDEDAVQDFLLWLWQSLPGLKPTPGKFASYLMRQLMWRRIDGHRRSQAIREEQPPEIVDDITGEPMTDDESLSLLALKQQEQSADDPIDDWIEERIDNIDDPFIRRVADLMLDGLTQEQIATRMKIPFDRLRKRLQRYRDTNTLDTVRLAA